MVDDLDERNGAFRHELDEALDIIQELVVTACGVNDKIRHMFMSEYVTAFEMLERNDRIKRLHGDFYEVIGRIDVNNINLLRSTK